MGIFSAPKAPAAAPPPPNPPMLASSAVQDAGAQARAAAAAAAGSQGFDQTIGTSAQGAKAPSTAKPLLGS